MGQADEFIVSEYDAFGPWIYKITEKNPIPPLFFSYYKENSNYLILIKIPRDIERRKAKPDMDLYDYVIGMYEDYGYILKRNGKEVEEVKFYYHEVESVEIYRSLLLGKLTIHLKNNTIIIPYNAVSIEIIFELVEIIRNRYTQNVYKSISVIDKDGEIDPLYESLIKERSLNGDVFPIRVFQPTINLNNTKLFGLISSRALLSTIHLLNDRELLVINRGTPIQYGKKVIHSYSFLYVPIEKIDAIKFEESKEYKSIWTIFIITKANTFKFYFDKKNQSLMDFYVKLNENK